MSTPNATPASSEITARLDLARSAALEAGQLTLRYFQTANLAVERKADDSPVTVADRGAEELLRQRIAERFAADGILGEEFGETPGSSGYRWILDPIDGTKSFISGVPLYGTMVAVERDGQALLGVVYIPGLDECIHAAIGQGAWHQRGQGPLTRARVSSRDKLSDAVVCSSDGGALDPAKQQAFDRLRRAARFSRTWGDCYGYLLVATGRVEIMVDPVLNVWDAAAVQPIVTEAGGTFTDWQGNPSIYAGESIATNSHLLDQVLAITRG